MSFFKRGIILLLTFAVAAMVCEAATLPSSVDAVPDTLTTDVSLDEIVVKPKKEKYSKKNNPAVDFVERIRSMSAVNDPYGKDYYSYNKYERITMALNNIGDSISGKGGILKQFGFLNEYIDSSSVTGKPILPFSVKEKTSEVYNRHDPKSAREYVTGIRRHGLDDFVNQESVQTFLEDVFREINLYQNDITLLNNRFVSPLSKIGPDFYKYYLTDTVNVDGERCAVLSFAPHNSATWGFVGRIYVPVNDSTMFIRRVDMNLSPRANVNFVESLHIQQNFEHAVNGARIKTSDILTLEFSVIPGTPGIYAQRYTRLTGHDFAPSRRPDLFERQGEVYTSAEAYIRDDDYWEHNRVGKIKLSEKNVGSLVASMRAVPIYYYSEKVLRLLVSGYVRTGRNSKVDLGPLNTLVSFNDVEGARFRVGGLTTAALNPHLFARGYVAYGTKDRKFKYSGEIEYSFNRKKHHSREFPMHSLRLTHLYDVNALGQDYAFTNPDNFFLSLKRTKDTLMIYHRQTKLDYIIELENHFSASLTLSANRQEASPYINFRYADGRHVDHINFNTAEITLRYAPGEKFMQTKSHRVPVNSDAPVFVLTHTYGPGNALGNRYTVNRTELNIRKRFWFSAFGYLDATLKGSHVWSTTPFTELIIPNANLSYTIQPESFALLNPMEFITDSYASLDLTYFANGAIFNYIPLVKKLKWREVFAIRGFIGHLSDKNNPEKNHWLPMFPSCANLTPLSSTPYIEASVGIENILRCIRLDYVWRLTYRNSPGIDRSGLRVALHFAF